MRFHAPNGGVAPNLPPNISNWNERILNDVENVLDLHRRHSKKDENKNRPRRRWWRRRRRQSAAPIQSRIRSLLLAIAGVSAAGRWHEMQTPRPPSPHTVFFSFPCSFFLALFACQISTFLHSSRLTFNFSFRFSSLRVLSSSSASAAYPHASRFIFTIHFVSKRIHVFRETKLMVVAFNLNRFVCVVSTSTARSYSAYGTIMTKRCRCDPVYLTPYPPSNFRKRFRSSVARLMMHALIRT